MPEKCATDNVVYRPIVETTSLTETYFGMAADQFKDRWSVPGGVLDTPKEVGHKVSFLYLGPEGPKKSLNHFH